MVATLTHCKTVTAWMKRLECSICGDVLMRKKSSDEMERCLLRFISFWIPCEKMDSVDTE